MDEERRARYVLVELRTSNSIPKYGVYYLDIKE